MDITTLLFPLLIVLLFIPIFLSGRRQRRQQAEMKNLQSALEPGDTVMTTSGLRATVVDASYEDTIDLEIADGIVTTWVRAAVREKVDHTVPDAEPAGSDHPVIENVPDEAAPSLDKGDPANGTARS
jgi:preprotein translocase subunit YajC